MLLSLVISVVTFYGGFVVGTLFSSYSSPPPSALSDLQLQLDNAYELLSECKSELFEESKKRISTSSSIGSSSSSSSSSSTVNTHSSVESNGKSPQFKDKDNKWNWRGWSKIDHTEFMSTYDLGMPKINTNIKNQEALILYHSSSSSTMTDSPDGSLVPLSDALAPCNQVDIIPSALKETDHCVVVLEHYQGYHVQRLVRAEVLQEGNDGKDQKWSKLDSSKELIHVGRGWEKGGDNFKPTKISKAKEYWKQLGLFFENIDDLESRLKEILKRIARDNTVIVMVCNNGVLDLMMNFVCSARARNLDISSLIVFATDEETRTALTTLGVEVFDDKGAFGSIPKTEAKTYGDQIFAKMMYVKVLAPFLPMMLGYNVLFQDVDVVWHSDPLPYFLDESLSGNFDAYFEDDGARSRRYAPYSPNSGFYFLRSNARNQHFLNALLMSGGEILVNHSHQQTMTAVLTEMTSLVGLSVKVLDPQDGFPGGKQFHHDKGYMMEWMEEKIPNPMIFHMCWTANKDDKLLYLKQLGEWFLPDECGNDVLTEKRTDGGGLAECCKAEPVISCHFKDKPSIIRCDESPDRDKGGRKFWP